jgi:hypothetical protein
MKTESLIATISAQVIARRSSQVRVDAATQILAPMGNF